MLFRFSPREGAAPAASQVVVIGALAEAGRQWGLSLGFVERITVSPTYMKGGDPDEVQDQVQWSLLTGGPASPPARRWPFSPLYMRVERTGTPALVARRLYGAQLVAGPEARAASLGVVSIARIEPPEDAMSLIYYDGRFPLAARFRVWRISRDGELPPLHLLEESKP